MYTMKKIFDFIMTAGLVCACSQPVVLSSGDEYVLDRWTLNQEGADVCYDVDVPSTVAGALVGNPDCIVVQPLTEQETNEPVTPPAGGDDEGEGEGSGT